MISLQSLLADHTHNLTIPGRDGKIHIHRDSHGVAHIKGTTSRDCYFAQGICIAQDRLFQLHYQRSLAKGQGAALLGKGLLRRDKQNRTIGYHRAAIREWKEQTKEAKVILIAYSEGISYIINKQIENNTLPYEFHILGIKRIDNWHPIDSLAVIKMVADSFKWIQKLQHQKVLNKLGEKGLKAFFPNYPRGTTVITSDTGWTLDQNEHYYDHESDNMYNIGYQGAINGGSNCWVVSGKRTKTGKPLVCGDPHLGITMPGMWYMVTMECEEFKVAGPCNPCYPGPVFYGTANDNVAWTMTHAQGDRNDLYVEKVRQRPNQVPEVLFKDTWLKMEVIEETIEVAGVVVGIDGAIKTVNNNNIAPKMIEKSYVQHKIYISPHHGAIIEGDPEKDSLVMANKWNLANCPSHDMHALHLMHHAKTYNDLKKGIRALDSISGNYCFADGVEGNIGYQYSGLIPKRPCYLLPVAGWDGKYEWDGNVPKNELPIVHNPDSGVVFSANNRHSDHSFPHYLSFYGFRHRAERLNSYFKARSNKQDFTFQDMEDLQNDSISEYAKEFILLMKKNMRIEENYYNNNKTKKKKNENNNIMLSTKAEKLYYILSNWDCDMKANANEPTIFHNVLGKLCRDTVIPYFKQVFKGNQIWSTQRLQLIDGMGRGKSSPILPSGKTWKELLFAAFEVAAEKYDEKKTWGDIHRIKWGHSLGRFKGYEPVFNLTSGKHMPVSGSSFTLHCTHGSFGGVGLAGVTYRQIHSLTKPQTSYASVYPGNSGQPSSPFYSNNLNRWRNAKTHKLYLNWDEIVEHSISQMEVNGANSKL